MLTQLHTGPILTGDDIPTSELLYDAFASMLSTDAPLEQAVPYMDQSLDVDLDVAFFEDFSTSLPTAPLHVTVPPGLGQELYVPRLLRCWFMGSDAHHLVTTDTLIFFTPSFLSSIRHAFKPR
jgi:hypothetical protein